MSADTGVTAKNRLWLGPVAMLVFAGLPLLLAGLIVANLGRWWEAGSAAAEQQERIVQMEGRIRKLAMERAGGAAKPEVDRAAIYLAAASPGLARAELQQRVVGLVERAGGRLIEVRGEDEPETATSVLLRATLDIGNDGLFDLLAAVETGVPLLTVESLNVRSQAGRSGAETPDPTLRVALAVRGHRKDARP